MTTTVMLDCVGLDPYLLRSRNPDTFPFSAIEIDDGQLQSTTEGNALSPGENFMTGFIW